MRRTANSSLTSSSFARPPSIFSGSGGTANPSHSSLRDPRVTSIGYSFEVRPTFRLLAWAIRTSHYTTRTHLTLYPIGQRRLRQYMPHCNRPRLRYYKRSYSFNPQSRFPDHLAESTGGLHRPNGVLSRTSTTLTPLTGTAEIRTRDLGIRSPVL